VASSAKVCKCGFPLPADWPPAVIERGPEPGTFGVIGNLYLCAPCVRTERIEP